MSGLRDCVGVMELSHTHTHTQYSRETDSDNTRHLRVWLYTHLHLWVQQALYPLPEGYQPLTPGSACPEPTGSEGRSRSIDLGARVSHLQAALMPHEWGCRLARTCVWHPINCRCPAFQHTRYLMLFPQAIIFQWGEKPRPLIIVIGNREGRLLLPW